MRASDFVKGGIDAAARLIQRIDEILAGERVQLEGLSRSIQLDGHSCGAECAFVVLRFYGKARSIRNVRKEARTTRDGTDQWSLRSLFERRGLVPKRINRPTLAKIRREIDDGTPVLVSVDQDHWAVVYGYGSGRILLADPSIVRSVACVHSTSEFERRWDGWALAVRQR